MGVFTRRWFVLAAILAGAGCEGVIDPSQNEISTFSGVIQPLGEVSHAFTVDRNGEVDVRITALGNPDALLLISYGQGNCVNAIILNSGYRLVSAVGVGGLVTRGEHCAYITDNLGTLRQATTYTLRVSHP